MALIVEDGKIVEGADSYVSEDDFIVYAESLGVEFSTGDDVEVMLRKAAIFIDSHEGRLKGERATRDQGMAFPRYGLVIDGWDWGEDEIPRQVTLAQMQVALAMHVGEDPYNPAVNQMVTKERVEGAIEVEYAAPTAFKLSKESTWQSLVNSLLKSSGLSLNLVRG